MTLKPLLQPVCGRCGKRREGIRHVCRSNSSRRATVTLKFSFGKCSKCNKDVTNPLTHNCRPKSDFKKRKAAAGKKPRAEKHDYQSCSDKDCQRSLCVAFRTGYKTGEADGFDRGWVAGFPAGQAACPLPHG